MQFSSEELSLLKKPMGILLSNDKIDANTLQHYISNAKMVVSVGDASTDRLLALDIVPDIQVVDGKERRMHRSYAGDMYVNELRCTNPAGNVTDEAIDVFKEALDARKPVRIVVDGEEDLMALVALAYAPDDTLIVYGQPLEGMVLVRVNKEARDKYRDLILKILRG